MTTILILSGQAAAHPSIGLLTAHEIAQKLKGKTCTTAAGAKFTFGEDGQYSYEGLWTNSGRYSIGNGTITILLDSGLERSFVISKRGDAFYIEETAVSCH